MNYITPESYDYIMGKYNRSGPDRFTRQDGLFDPGTGMSPEKIHESIRLQDAAIRTKPRSIRKAKGFECVLKNTRISCDPRDVFPAINMIDRPLNAAFLSEWWSEVFDREIPEVAELREHYYLKGIATLIPDFDHNVPIWDRVLSLGFQGLLQESERVRAERTDLTAEQDAFYEGIRITYSAILMFLARLEQQALLQGSCRMAAALSHLKDHAPDSFYEALLVVYLYFILSEHIEGLQVRSLSNFDRLFYPLYRKDLERGVAEEEIRRDLAYFLLQFSSIDNYWNQPMFLGGCKETEETEINELSYVFIDVYDRMGIHNPKLQIKYAESMPREFVLKVLDMIRRGHNSVVFVNDATIRTALMRVGASKEQARLCEITGCYEYKVQGAVDTGMNYMNLLKPLEYALHEGCDGVSGEFAGRKSPNPAAFTNFDSFYAEYKLQLEDLVNRAIQIVNTYEDYLAYINPQPMLSATYPTCLERGKEPLADGAVLNDTHMAFGFMADIADSLTIIKKYVYDQKKLTLSEFRDILDKNYEGHEMLRREILADRDKYGNNKDLPDSFTIDIVEFLCSKICGRANAKKRGGRWNIGFHVARQSYIQGEHTAASPNGRLKGEELSKNMSASMGMNREGPTAAILSVTKVDTCAFIGDSCLDLGLLPSAVKGDDGLAAMHALISTFMKRGGHAIHINVFDADTLRKAQQEPEKYQDLQIRVCGWNVLFNNISKVEQDGFIKQAEALV